MYARELQTQNLKLKTFEKVSNFILNPKRVVFVVIAVLTFTGLGFVKFNDGVSAANGIRKTINFQGKLVNSNGTNVADGDYDIVFKIYTQSSGGAAVWTENRTGGNDVTVSQGIFQVELGSVETLPGSVNFNTDSLYLGITVEADSEMTPRVRFTSVPQAFNAEKVNGLTVTNTSDLPFSSATTLKIGDGKTVVVNNGLTFSGTDSTTFTFPSSGGNVVTEDFTQTLTNKSIGSSGLTFSGATTDVTTGTNENFVLIPNGTGKIGFNNTNPLGSLDIRPNGATGGTISVASVSGATSFAALLVDNGGAGDIFAASTSGVPKFVVKNNGQLYSSNYTNNGGILYTATSGTLQQTAGGSEGLCLTFTGGLPAWGPCTTGGGSNWDVLSGAITPKLSSTLDFLLGGTSTTSAKFAVLGINNARGTQTASLSGNLVLDAAGSLQTTKGQTLNIGGTTTGNVNVINKAGSEYVTFDTVNSRVGIGTTTPESTLHVEGVSQLYKSAGPGTAVDIQATAGGTGNTALNLYAANGTSNVGAQINVDAGANNWSIYSMGNAQSYLSGNLGIGNATPISQLYVTRPLALGATGKVLAIFDQIENQDILAASSAGVTKFVIKNDGTASSSAGFTINGAGALQSTNGQTLTLGGTTTGFVNIDSGSGKINLLDNTSIAGVLDGLTGLTLASGPITLGGSTGTGLCLTGGATASWGSCGSSSGSNWLLSTSNGTLNPINNTLDLLIGGTSTASAKFAVLGINDARGTQTASVSGNLVLDAAGSLQTTKNQTLTIGGSTTGDISVSPRNGIGTLTVNGTLGAKTSGGATIVVATTNTSAKGKLQADFVCEASDCDTTIEAAITALPEGGGVIALLEGTYVIDSNGIDITKSNTSIIGAGKSTILQRGWDTASNDGVVSATNVNNITIAELAIDGVKGTYAGVENDGIAFSNVTYSTIRNVYTHDNDGDGIYFNASSNNNVNGNNSQSNDQFGIYFESTAINNTIANNNVQSNFYGIYLLTSDRNSIVGNNIQSQSGRGIFLYGATGNTITGNNIQANSQSGLFLDASSDSNIISSNKFHDNGGNGATSTIYVLDSDSNIFSSNDITDTAGSAYAIEILSSTSDNNFLIGNRFSGAGANAIEDLGTGTIIQHRERFAISGNSIGKALLMLNQTNATQDILTASSSGATKFVIKNDGTASSSAGFTINGVGALQSTNGNTLTLGGTTTGFINLDSGSGKINLLDNTSISGTLDGLTGLTLASGPITLGGSTGSGLCLTGGATASWGSCGSGGGGSNWVLSTANGTLSPINNTLDFLLGGTSTTSAKFAIKGIASGTPVATLTATTNNNGLVFDAANSSIQSLRNNTLTLGGNTTGNITISPRNSSGVVNLNGQLFGAYGSSDGDKIFNFKDAAGNNMLELQKGAVEGTEYGSLYLPNGDLLNIRNIQGGTAGTGEADDLNLDLGSGSSTPGERGNIVMNWDVGRGVQIYDGSGADSGLVAAFNETTDNIVGDNLIKFFRNTTIASGMTGGNASLVVNQVGAATNDLFTASAAGLTKFVIANDGKVGVGVPIPTVMLDVAGDISITQGSHLYLYPGAAASSIYRNAVTGDTVAAFANNSSFVLRANDATEVLRMTSGGNLGVGTASPISSLHITRPLTFGATGKALAVFDQIENQDILAASSSGITKFVIKNDGTASSSAGFTINGAGALQSTNGQTLTLGGTTTGFINLDSGSGKINLLDNTSITGTLDGLTGLTLASGPITLGGSTGTGQCLTGGGTASWGSCGTGGGSSNWVLSTANGTLSPINNTLDLLWGGTTTISAKFAIKGVAAGTPVATISATTNNNGLVFDAANSKIQSLLNNTLTFGGDTTGDILILPRNGAGIVTVSGTLGAKTSGGATLVVATTDTSAKGKLQADYVCAATDCDTTIEAAITALPAGGGVIQLLEGTYIIDSNGIDITKSNTSIIGAGKSTILQRDWDSASDDGVITATSVSNITIADLAINGVKATYQGIENNGIFFSTSVTYSTIRNVYSHDNDGKGIYLVSSSNNTITGNNSQSNDDYGLYLFSSSNNNTIVGNNFQSNTFYGIVLNSTNNNNTITGNNVQSNLAEGILLLSSHSNNITGNKLHDNASSGANDSIALSASDLNTISSNDITDTAGTGYAINVADSTSDNNYLLGNNYSGTGATRLNDQGTGTTIQHRDRFAISGDSIGKAQLMLNQTSASQDIFTASSSGSTKFVITKAGGFAFNPAGNNPGLLSTLDVRANTTNGGTISVASVSGATSFAGLMVDNSGTGDIFTASSSGTTRFTIRQSGVVYIGTATDGLSFDYTSGGPIYTGTARPTKKITLSPEYAGGVITASGSATVTGSLVTDASPSADLNRTYYEWTSTQNIIQDYVVAVRVTLPNDFSDWISGTTMSVTFNTADTATTANGLDVYMYNSSDDSTGRPVYYSTNNVSNTDKTWKTINLTAGQIDNNDSPDWDAAGETVTIYLKMKASGTVNYTQLGDIVLNYYAKF